MSSDVKNTNLSAEETGAAKKKRHRPKSKALRFDLKNRIETALLAKNSPILHLCTSTGGTDLSAPLDEILSALGYDDGSSVRELTKFQFRSISNISRLFDIIGADDEPLQLVFDSRHRENLEDKTVYVDNLPPSCSEELLRRRAKVFGTVVHVNLPIISRLRRRCSAGSDAPQNSGFAFVQFSSKTAVRRFCKRYAANCHLNRPHHPKPNRKRKSQQNMNASANAEPDQTKPDAPSLANEPASARNPPQFGDSLERRKRRSTEVSVSGLDSGTESDIGKASRAPQQNEGDKKKKKRIRKRKTPMPELSLANYLGKIQVFPYQKYKSLKQEYLDMKNANMQALKIDLRSQGLIHSNGSDTENIDYASQGDGQPPSQARRRRRRRSRPATVPQKKTKRSRANVLKAAAQLKDESFQAPVSGQNENAI